MNTIERRTFESSTRSGADVILKDFLGKDPSQSMHAANICLQLPKDEHAIALNHLYLTESERLCTEGIIADFDLSRDFISTQVDAVADIDPVIHDALHANHSDKSPQDLWNKDMPMSEISDLFEYGQQVDVKSIVLYSANLLSALENSPYDTYGAYQAAYEAETIYAPLCEIIGLYGLADAMRSKVACMQLVNTDQGHFVDEAERIHNYYLGSSDERDNYEQVRAIVQDIIDISAGPNSHELVLGSDSGHGIVLGEGSCADKRLRVVWRLKSVGSLAKRLQRTYVDSGESRTIDLPLDILGITLIADDENHLATTFADLVRNLSKASHVTTYPSPARDQAFHIRGSEEFVDKLKGSLGNEFPDEDLFEYKEDDTGFLVAKATGFYENNSGCFGFEVQTLTQEARKDSRIGKSAHLFYKLMRQLGKRHVPTEEELYLAAKLNRRRKEFLDSDILSDESEQRILNIRANSNTQTLVDF